MGVMKNFLITIHNGGDEAVAAVQRTEDAWGGMLEQAAAEAERLRLTDEEVDNIRFAAKRLDYSEGANMDSCTAAVLLLMLERLGHDSGKDLDE